MANLQSKIHKRPSTPSQILSRINKGDISPLYFLYGPEEYEKEEFLKTLIEVVLKPSVRTFNLDLLRAEDLDPSDTSNRILAFPLMDDRRIIVIKRAEHLTDLSSQNLLNHIKNPPDTTVLIFTAEKVDTRKKVFSELRKSSISVEFRQPFDNMIPTWIQNRAQSIGKLIEPEAVHQLFLSIGSNLRDLANELDKLAISIDNRQTVTKDDVTQIVGNTKGSSVFELADAVGNGQIGLALSILKGLIDQGENPVGIVALLIRHINILRKAKWLKSHQIPRSKLAKELKIPTFFLSGYIKQASRFEDRDLWKAYDALLEADNKLKSRSRTTSATLYKLIYSLCQSSTQEPNLPSLDTILESY